MLECSSLSLDKWPLFVINGTGNLQLLARAYLREGLSIRTQIQTQDGGV